jgi:hypothetical protein
MDAEGMDCGLDSALGRVTGSFENYDEISESIKEISRQSTKLLVPQEELFFVCFLGL